jgi:hypothetical protein
MQHGRRSSIDFNWAFFRPNLTYGRFLRPLPNIGGFGPGGNETGVIVYSLPSAVAEQIADKGLQYFSSPGRQAFGWLATPIETGNLSWSETKRLEGSSGSQAKRLEDFLNRYGFGIEIPSWISRLANQAIVSPGNFFSYGPGGGVIIVIPAERKVVLAYAG